MPRSGKSKAAGRLKFSLGIGGTLSSTLDQAFRAEEFGYDFIWVPDHLTDIPPASAVYDAWTMLAYIGAKTSRAMLASGVTDTQRMHPAKTASTVATLDNLTGGRAVLGIGAGEVMNTRPYGMEWESADVRILRVKEYIQVVKTLWSSSFEHQVGFEGELYNFKEAHLGLAPVQKPGPPIYVGAFASNAMLEIAGELADGWYPGSFYSPEGFKEKVKVVRDAATGAGRRPSEVDLVATVPVIFGSDAKTMENLKKAFRRSLVINRYMLRLLGEEEAYEIVSKTLQYQLIAPTPAYAKLLEKTFRSLPISDEALERGISEMMAVGTAAEVTEAVARFVKAGASHVHIANLLGGESTVRRFAEEVIPALRG
ncbi:MAG: LLM class flavin-dependent oxidoreductase [Thaumarchaeota archaeon]|nr:LLM class flavin-dependent oxidoreductase [Nitrososphaerota archaeon]